MKQWKLAYELVSSFSAPVIENHYKLRCFPRESDKQRVLALSYDVSSSSWSSLGKDSFGNTFCAGCCREPHDKFVFTMSAEVERLPGPEYEGTELFKLGMYRRHTFLTAMGERLDRLFKSICIPDGACPWEKASCLMEATGRTFNYESGKTSFDTTAEEALKLGSGVCQDYTHIFLSLCRKAGLTARYAAGAIPGEGATHAWAEVFEGGYWKGFDPTHNRETDENYIVFATGTDAAGCTLNRGVFKSGMETGQNARIIMNEVER